MGVVSMPSKRMYLMQYTRYPLIADIMSRNRFDTLLKYLHFNDNASMVPFGQEGYDKLHKVRPLIEAVKRKFLEIPPSEHQSIDEQMVPFKGRSSIKQYMKNKPHKWGYKFFTRASSNGIVHDFEFYQGKNTVLPESDEFGISGAVILRLTNP